jgi:hypothetical protein
MGCLPLPFLFVLGALIGQLFGETTACCGDRASACCSALVSAGAFIWLIRRGK